MKPGSNDRSAMTEEPEELLDLIRRGRRSSVDSHQLLLASSELMDQRARLRYVNRILFQDIVALTREFVEELDRSRPPQAENQS